MNLRKPLNIPIPETTPEAHVGRTLGFLASVIKSGEPWTATCEVMLRQADDSLKLLASEHLRREQLENILDRVATKPKLVRELFAIYRAQYPRLERKP